MNAGVKVVKQFQTELLSPLITKLLEKVEKRMSGCHVPDCLSVCCTGLKNEIAALSQDVKKNWEVTYKRGETFGKRLIALEEQPTRANEEVAQLAQFVDDFVHSANGRIENLICSFNTLKKRIDQLDIIKKCQPCQGIGKVVAQDLSPNSQGEDDRWIVVDCPGCKGKKFVNI